MYRPLALSFLLPEWCLVAFFVNGFALCPRAVYFAGKKESKRAPRTHQVFDSFQEECSALLGVKVRHEPHGEGTDGRLALGGEVTEGVGQDGGHFRGLEGREVFHGYAGELQVRLPGHVHIF